MKPQTPHGYYPTLLAATFVLMTNEGWTADTTWDVDFGGPLNRPQPAPEGFEYACSYPIIDDIGPGYVHAFYHDESRTRIFLPDGKME